MTLLESKQGADGVAEQQINRVISHPTLPITITAHEDRHIRFFDNNTGMYTPYEDRNLTNKIFQKLGYWTGSWREATSYSIVILIYNRKFNKDLEILESIILYSIKLNKYRHRIPLKQKKPLWEPTWQSPPRPLS